MKVSESPKTQSLIPKLNKETSAHSQNRYQDRQFVFVDWNWTLGNFSISQQQLKLPYLVNRTIISSPQTLPREIGIYFARYV